MLFTLFDLLYMKDCNLCSYEYNFQPVDSYLCNLSCNCSIEIVCSAALMQKNTSSTKATIRWYALNITSNTALLINEEQLVTEKIINDHIMSSLVIPRINKKEQFTEYWCTIEDPTYKGIFKKSNIFTVVEEHNVSNCTKSVELQYRWNKTCAVLSVNASNDEGTESSGIELVVISCVGTFISIVIFLTVIAVYCILHFKAKGKSMLHYIARLLSG